VIRFLRLPLSAAGCLLATTLVVAQAGVPHRIFGAAASGFTDLNALLMDAAGADVLVFGEPQGQPVAHRLELAVLEGLATHQRDVILVLEMFDRTAQEPLDHFLMGHLTEPDFLAAARPWPRYATDYKPLVDFAARRSWPVIGSSAPHALVAEVARTGFETLRTRSDRDRALVAREVECPTTGAYFMRFQAAFSSGQPVAGIDAEDRTLDISQAYRAQCLRDETIAETIAQVLTAGASGGKRPLVVSVNGAFRSEFGGGVVERARRRLPGKRVVVVNFVPVVRLDALAPAATTSARADYVVYVGEKP